MFAALAPWAISLIVGIGLQVIGYMLMGQPKQQKPDSVKDMEAPQASAGMPIIKVFGEKEVEGINILFYTDKQTVTYETSA